MEPAKIAIPSPTHSCTVWIEREQKTDKHFVGQSRSDRFLGSWLGGNLALNANDQKRESIFGRMIGPYRMILLFGFVTFLLIGFTSCRGARVTVEDIKNEIASEIPIGSPSTQVLAFLVRKKLEHSDIVEFTEYEPKGGRSLTEYVPSKVRVMTAAIRNVRQMLFISYDISIKFYFDDEGRLTSFTVEEMGNGP
jgi:hypothetical protein